MRPFGKSGFRRRNAAFVASEAFGPDMTPMVDIVMVILIFFMAGSAFIGPEWFLDVGMAKGASPDAPKQQAPSLDLPQTKSVLRLARANASTRVSGLDLDNATLEALDVRLRDYASTGAAGAVRLVIEPSLETPYQDVIAVYDRCSKAGFAGVGLAKARAK